jgi:hypothetical protein
VTVADGGVPIERTAYKGLQQTHERMAKYISEGIRTDMGVRGLAARTLRDAGFPKTSHGKAEVLRDYVKKNVGYGNDPVLTEFISKAHVTLCTGDVCAPYEDCDGHVVALLSLLGSMGVDVNILALDYGGGIQPHVLGVFKDDSGQWVEIDSTTDLPIGHVSSAMRKTRIDPFDPKFTPEAERGKGTFVGAGKARQDGAMVTTHEAIFGRGGDRSIGAGLVTPGDILAYRAVWDQYVLDTVRVCLDCGQALQDSAAQQNNSESPVAAALGKQWVADGNNLYAQWNIWQNLSDSNKVLQGAAILQSYQQTVLACGTERGLLTSGTITCSLTYHDAQGQVVAAAPGADPSLQVRAIARLEGLGILGDGILQILVQGAGDALVEAGSAASYAAKLAANTTSWLLSPWTWAIAGTLVFGTIGVVVWKSGEVAKLVSAGYGHAAEAGKHPLAQRKLRRSRGRRKMGRR